MIFLRRVLSLIVLLALTIGLPAGMLWVDGPPIPSGLPTVNDVTDFLSRPDDGTLLLIIARVVVWGAWTGFAWSVAAELSDRVRGVQPRAIELGISRRLAAGLISSALLAGATSQAHAVARPVAVGTTAPPSVLTQQEGRAAPQASRHGRGPRSYRVKPGDSLSKIARAQLGSAGRWPAIWRLNARRRQADGRVFTNPSLIFAGWKLKLPERAGSIRKPRKRAPRHSAAPGVTPQGPAPTRTPETRPTAAPTQVPGTSVAPSADRVVIRRPIITVSLPSGTFVALSFAAGVSTALAAARLRRRRAETPSDQEAPLFTEPPPFEPAVTALRRSHLRHDYIQQALPIPTDAELVNSMFSIDVPDQIAVGIGPGGLGVALPISALRLGLIGPGAADAVRSILLNLRQSSDNYRTDIVIAAEDASLLLGSAVTTRPGLVVAATWEEAIDHLEVCLLARSRKLAEREADDIYQLLEAEPDELLPATLLFGTGPPDDRLEAVIKQSDHCGIGSVLLSPWPSGTTGQVDPDGDVVEATGEHEQMLLGARLHQVTHEDAAHVFRLLADNGDEPKTQSPDEEPTEPPVATQAEAAEPFEPPNTGDNPPLISLLLIGTPTVMHEDVEIPIGRDQVVEMLVYLAMHPQGATKAQICAALWPDGPVGQRFHSTLKHLRTILNRAVQTGEDLAFVSPKGGRYRMDTTLISCDLWDFERFRAAARHTTEPEERRDHLQRAVALIRGELAEGLDYEWLDEERYPFRTAQCNVITRLAELAEPDDPEQALDVLEQVRALDPDIEATYRSIIRIQLRLGRQADAERTANLLKQRLRSQGLSPDAESRDLIRSLKVPQPSRGN